MGRMSVSAYITWFFLASYAGWLFESSYSVARTGHWEKRGFLFGPFCPIYGAGVLLALLAFDRPEVASGEFPAWAVFFASMLGSAVLEYGVSVGLERMFGAVWWDYSDLPLNVHGRICLPASLLFGAGGVLVAYVVAPLLHGAYASVPAVAFELFALVAVSLLSCDLTATVISLSDLMEKITAIDYLANERADARIQQVAGALHALPAQIQGGGDKVVGVVKESGSEAARLAQDMVAEQRERLVRTASRLTARQVWLLGQLRRFRTADLRNKAGLLLEAMRLRDGDASAAGANDDGDA